MMNDKYGVSCGCTIETVPMDGMELMHRVVIIHCPLHANAEKMRDALKKIRAIMHISEPIDVIVNAALKELD